jgi:hypothetical protein
MKLFSNLSDIHKERAIHMAEHIVMQGLIDDGFSAIPSSEEEKEHYGSIQSALAEAKTLPTPADQAQFIFENPITGDLVFEQAYELASTAIYVEKDEVSFSLKDIDCHFADSEENNSEEDAATSSEGESLIKGTITNMVKKDNKQLN